MEVREFPNNFADYGGQELLEQNGQVERNFAASLAAKVKQLLGKLELEFENDANWNDPSVYTGTAGVALMYYHLYQNFKDGNSDTYLHKALWYADGSVKHIKHRGVSFLCGDSGPLAVAAVLYNVSGHVDKAKDALNRLLSLSGQALNDNDIPDEILFGRAGYLFTLLFIRHHLGDAAVSQGYISQVANKIIKSGRRLKKHDSLPSPLVYEWHEKKYLGAAHGFTGIMYMLMQASYFEEFEIHEVVKPTIDFLMSLKFPSGNYPSSIGSGGGDKLVHWCHGAPGWVYMFIAAYKIYQDAKYLDAAKSCGEVLWSRGLLRKGYGICHGVSGNAYGMLALFNLTDDKKYLYRALKFAEWCFDYNKHGCRTPDRPYSLFEGLAGTIYFLADIIHPLNARFPAYQLNL